MDLPNRLLMAEFAPLGRAPVVFLDVDDPAAERIAGNLAVNGQSIVIGVDYQGTCPSIKFADFDMCITVVARAPAPWVGVPMERLGPTISSIRSLSERMPHAASLMRQVLRIGEGLSLKQAILLESMAYSTALGGSEFRQWRHANPTRARRRPDRGCVRFERVQDEVTITLASPTTQNAMSAAMRDDLFDALAAVADDPTEPGVTLRAEGRCFSVGGDLDEFGSATDLAQAHSIRTARSVATLLHDLGPRARVVVHGACIGSGIEIPAAAHRRHIRGRAFAQLPELSMGLIPGAGGSATISRAIGRHRTFFMALSMHRIPHNRLLEWGLMHAGVDQ